MLAGQEGRGRGQAPDRKLNVTAIVIGHSMREVDDLLTTLEITMNIEEVQSRLLEKTFVWHLKLLKEHAPIYNV